MNYLFIIQGEGRGHLSQAIALREQLEKEGHVVVKAFMGESPARIIPIYAREIFGKGLSTFRSPNFIKTRDKKGIRPGLSILYNLLFTPVFIYSIFLLRKEIRKKEYGCIVNFYDMIGGLAVGLSFTRKRTITISHHYFLVSSFFDLPRGYFLSKFFLKLHSAICALGSSEIRALSFTFHSNIDGSKLRITPPILREEIFCQEIRRQGFILVYLLNSGWIIEIENLAQKFPDTKFKIFTDNIPLQHSVLNNISFFEPNQGVFLKELAACNSLITTAGFESQCEAAFLGKIVYTLPSKNHFEQVCNALDGRRAGISLAFENFIPLSKTISSENEIFRKWCLSGHK
ncbi:MAG: hypothetical protein K9H49_03465 [Bacteroidales bacterium]|nr:hypothetical protein [Bacteroidales bacterium]MCF8391122.1 hypothetical protein [Bacteroidales bacterium]